MVVEPPAGAKPTPVADSDLLVEVSFRPQGRHPGLPAEVFDRGELLGRIPASHRGRRHRADLHLLLVCVGGEGAHVVDFVEYSLMPGTVIRVRPGQTYEYRELAGLSMYTVIWRSEHHVELPGRAPWFPGGPDPTQFVLFPQILERERAWVWELRAEQDRFDGSPQRVELMRTILRALLLLVDSESDDDDNTSVLPAPYVELRELLEAELYRRPSVQSLASQLGYSSRTLDRACKAVAGQTARQLVDDRIRLELRRLLADETTSIGQVGRSFGFDEATNFTKFVRRVVGQSPSDFRQSFGPDPATVAQASEGGDSEA